MEWQTRPRGNRNPLYCNFRLSTAICWEAGAIPTYRGTAERLAGDRFVGDRGADDKGSEGCDKNYFHKSCGASAATVGCKDDDLRIIAKAGVDKGQKAMNSDEESARLRKVVKVCDDSRCSN